ncbi:MAG: hypothetical protein H6732_20290 [Alphaproteobacteria bacterium]|nr:hypothetical protein [Alphaproteobacteria bacterium]
MRPVTLPVLLLAACAFANGTGPRDSDTSDTGSPSTPATGDCPIGTTAATRATLQVDELAIDGASVPGTFDASATVDGQPSACVSEDGTDVILLLGDAVGNQAAEIRVSSPSAASYELDVDPGYTLFVTVQDELLGAVTWAAWGQGELTVTSVGTTFDFTVIDAQGESGGAQLRLGARGTITR